MENNEPGIDRDSLAEAYGADLETDQTATSRKGTPHSLVDARQIEIPKRRHLHKSEEAYAHEERVQRGRIVEIVELKKDLARDMSELRRVETTTLPVQRKAQNMDKEYDANTNAAQSPDCLTGRMLCRCGRLLSFARSLLRIAENETIL